MPNACACLKGWRVVMGPARSLQRGQVGRWPEMVVQEVGRDSGSTEGSACRPPRAPVQQCRDTWPCRMEVAGMATWIVALWWPQDSLEAGHPRHPRSLRSLEDHRCQAWLDEEPRLHPCWPVVP